MMPGATGYPVRCVSQNTSDLTPHFEEWVLPTRDTVLCTPEMVAHRQEILSYLQVSAQCAREKLPHRLRWCVCTAD